MSIDLDFTSFASTMWPKLVRGALGLGVPLDVAEDVSQDALASCYARWKHLGRMADQPESYCYRAMVNKLKSRWRRRQEASMECVPETAVVDDTSLDRSVLRSSLLALPLAQREVLVCRYLLDLSEFQTARVLGIPAGTVKSRHSRALRTLAADPLLPGLLTRTE